MKSKEELIGDYREMVENNALHKDAVFLEVLIGFDHGVGHPLLLLCHAKASNYLKEKSVQGFSLLL